MCSLTSEQVCRREDVTALCGCVSWPHEAEARADQSVASAGRRAKNSLAPETDPAAFILTDAESESPQSNPIARTFLVRVLGTEL